MTKKIITLLASSAIALMVTGTAFSAKAMENEQGKNHTKLNAGMPEYEVFVADMRFKNFMKDISQEQVKEKLSLRLDGYEQIQGSTMEKLLVDHGKGLQNVPAFLNELKEVYSTYLSTENLPSSDRYFQKAVVGYAFALSKLEGPEPNLERLKAIAESSFSERRRSFARYTIIEQETKPTILKIEKNDRPEENIDKLIKSYNGYKRLLQDGKDTPKSKVSLSTQASIKYHMAEIEYYLLINGIKEPFEETLDYPSIRKKFQEIAEGSDALGFTKGLAGKFLREKFSSELP